MMRHRSRFRSCRPFAAVWGLAGLFAGGPLAAGEVTLLSRADPAEAPDTPSGAANILALSADGRWTTSSCSTAPPA